MNSPTATNAKDHLDRAIVELYYAHAEIALDDTATKNVDMTTALASARSLIETVRTLLSNSPDLASNSSHPFNRSAVG